MQELFLKNANQLSLEDPGDSFAGPTASALRQFSSGLGGRYWPQSGGPCPMGIAGPERAALGPAGDPAADHQAPRQKKLTAPGIINDDFAALGQDQPVILSHWHH